ncbi:hypothetical protein L7F22_041472 [Adiantum nelumboides]|nr:hypothetical protein [Adiantum nelumboides]
MGEPSSSWQNFNFRDDEGSAQGMQALRLLLAKLQEAQANPRLKPSVNNLLMIEDLMLTSTQRLPSSVAPMHLEGGEGVPVMHGPMQANVVPHPLQGPLQTDGAKKKQYHGQERHVGKIREEGDFHDDDDEPPSRSRHKKRTNERRTKRSRRNSSGGSSSSSQSGRSSHGRFLKKGRKSPTPPTSPSFSPRGESSLEESSSTYKGRHPRRKHHAWKRAKKLKKFKEGGKSITFQTFDGSYGHVDKVLTFIQQFDAAFGGEDFIEASKLRNVAMHLTKSARHWWSTLCAKNQAPKTWKVCRLTIMKQFLDDDAEDNVLTAWRSLKFKEGESLQNYIEKFWDTCLKATVYRNINFSKKRQQFCARLPEDMRTYVQALRPKTIAAVIHYTRVAYKIFKPKNPPNKGDKGKDKENGSSNVKSNNKKQASKRPYQGTNRLSPEEMERYRKENRCFQCGTTGKSSSTSSMSREQQHQQRRSKQACLESGQNCNQADNNSRENPFRSMKDQNLLSGNNSSEHMESQVIDCTGAEANAACFSSMSSLSKLKDGGLSPERAAENLQQLTPISSLGSEVTSHSTDGLCKLLNSVENKDGWCTLEHSVDAFQGSHLKQLLTAAHLISDSKLSNKEVFEPSQYAADVGRLMSEIVLPLNVNLEGWQSGALSSLSDLSIQFRSGSLLSVDTSGHQAVKNRHFDSLPTGCPSDHEDDKSLNDAKDPESEAPNKVSLSIQRGFHRRYLDFRISDGLGINNTPSSLKSNWCSMSQITSPGLPSPNLCLKTSRQCTSAMSDAARNIDSNELLPCHLLRESTCAAPELDCQPYATCPPAGTCSSSCNLPSGIGLHLNSLTGGTTKLQSARGERKNAGYLTCVKLANDVGGATPPCRQSAYQPVEVLPSPSSTVLQTNLQLVECFEEFGNCLQRETNMEEQLVISFVEELERDLCRDQSVAHVDLSAARNRQLSDFEPCCGQVETYPCELKTFSLSTVPCQMDVDGEQEWTFRSGVKARKWASSGDNYENGCKRCNCKKSKCLKLYCECFAAGLFCVDNCSCQECHNKPTFEAIVLEIRQQIESRNPLAFAPRVVKAVAQALITGVREKTSESTPPARHKKGCSCKKSKCLKKHCECYQAGVGCSESCRCEGCQNMYGKKEGSEGFEGKVVRTEFNGKDTAEDSIVSMEFGSKLSHGSHFQHDDLSPITPLFRSAGYASQQFSQFCLEQSLYECCMFVCGSSNF